MGDIYLEQNHQRVGQLGQDGRVTTDGFREIGRVDDQGRVYEGSNFRPIGEVDQAGKVHQGEFGGQIVGRVENDGAVYDREYGGLPIARVEAPHLQRSGAAFLLLIR